MNATGLDLASSNHLKPEKEAVYLLYQMWELSVQPKKTDNSFILFYVHANH